jgi:hypothetical protein
MQSRERDQAPGGGRRADLDRRSGADRPREGDGDRRSGDIDGLLQLDPRRSGQLRRPKPNFLPFRCGGLRRALAQPPRRLGPVRSARGLVSDIVGGGAMMHGARPSSRSQRALGLRKVTCLYRSTGPRPSGSSPANSAPSTAVQPLLRSPNGESLARAPSCWLIPGAVRAALSGTPERRAEIGITGA